jgi:DNA (cytosine-5)-methyltransferase 1
MKERRSLLSLFSGAGGLDLGFKLSGKFDVVFGNDISTPAMKTHSRNFGTRLAMNQPTVSDLPAVFLGDVAKLDFDVYKHTSVDVVSGGPPCQDFSVVRGPQKERGGISVSRGKLYSYFVRALVHLQPSVFVFENVPGLLSANKMEAYKVIKNDFSNPSGAWQEIGELVGNNATIVPKDYEIIFSDLVNAANLGVPQARRRLIIIGLRKDLSQQFWWKLPPVKKEVTSFLSNCNVRLAGKYPLTPLETFEGKPLSELQGKYAQVMRDYSGVSEEVQTPRATWWKENVWDKLTFDAVKDYLVINRIDPKSEEEIQQAFEEHTTLLKELGYYGVRVSDLKCPDGSNNIPKGSKPVQERMSRIPPDENHEFVRGTIWEVEGRGISLIYRRTHPLKPAYTVVAYGGGGTWGYHYEKQRAVLTNRERARLQTFPDSFLFEGSRSETRAQIGEAVPPLMGKRIAQATSRILEEFS